MNAFKRIAAGHAADEKTALFSGAAAKAYGLQVSGWSFCERAPAWV
jgi:hypothetical protein